MRSLIFLILLSPFVFADEIQLNTFQNGEVADADEVNENFNNLKQVIQELKETVKRVSCNAVEGDFLNDSCSSPELDTEITFDSPVVDYTLLNIDTSSFEFASSNNMEINLWASPSGFNINCQLLNKTTGIVSTFFVSAAGGNNAYVVPIQDREMHTMKCTASTSNPFGGSVNINVDVEFF